MALCDTPHTIFYSSFITGRPARSAAMPVLFLLKGQKWVFRPAGATRCPNKREIWHGERTCGPLRRSAPRLAQGADLRSGFLRSAPRAKFHVYWSENVGIQPQNCQNFEFWPEICTSGETRLQYFYEILSVCTRL